jgi:hypothetical protein
MKWHLLFGYQASDDTRIIRQMPFLRLVDVQWQRQWKLGTSNLFVVLFGLLCAKESSLLEITSR